MSHPDEIESGYQALAAILGRQSLALRRIMASPNFQPVAGADVVPVRRCQRCLDGGLHTIGCLCGCITAHPVFACDTCGEVVLNK